MSSTTLGYLILGFVVLFMLYAQVLPRVRARQARGKAVPELDGLLSDAQRREPRLLLYFWSPSCGMCRPMTPLVDKLAAERPNVIKINVAERMDVARRIGVMGTPSVALIEGGSVAQLLIGPRNEAQMRALLAG